MMRVAVIGGGAAGLATLKHLIQAQECLSTEPVEVWLFEKEASVGGTFRYRTYEDGEVCHDPVPLVQNIQRLMHTIAGVITILDQLFRLPNRRRYARLH
jgi:glycine/D-amino acid oxidase-like deaminating enzyme